MRSITEIVKQFKENWTEEINPVNIEQACRDSGMTWIDSMLNPVVTIQLFFLQSCMAIRHAPTCHIWLAWPLLRLGIAKQECASSSKCSKFYYSDAPNPFSSKRWMLVDG